MFSTKLLDHFEHPRNVAELEAPNASATVENPVCGDVLRIAVLVEAGRVEQISFKAKGCVPAMACGSAVAELALGQSVATARQITREQVSEAVGGLPPASSHAAQLAVDCLLSVLDRLAEDEIGRPRAPGAGTEGPTRS